MEQCAEDGFEGKAYRNGGGQTGCQQTDITYHTRPGTQNRLQRLGEGQSAVNGGAGAVKHSTTGNQDRSGNDDTDDDIKANVKTGIGQLIKRGVLALRGNGVQNEVHTDEGGTDQRHGVHQATFGNNGNQTGYNLAQIGGNGNGGNKEQNTHYADKNLHDGFQHLIGSKGGNQSNNADDESGDPLGHTGDILQTGRGADLISCLKCKAGDADGKTDKDLDKEAPAAAFGLQGNCRINNVLLGNDGDTGGHFHHDNEGDAGEHNCPQQGILELNTDQCSSSNSAGTDECAGNNSGRSHVFQLLHKSLFFHFCYLLNRVRKEF